LCSYSDDKDLNVGSEKFKNMHKICLSVLQHAAIDTNAIKVVRDLSISTLDTCQDCMYRDHVDNLKNKNYVTNISGDLQSAIMLYTCINACPSFPTQDGFDVKQKLVSQSNWKLYTIYKDQAIALDQKLLFLFKDAMHLYYSNQINSNEITNCDVCIANYIYVISFIKILYQYSLFLYVGTNDSIVN